MFNRLFFMINAPRSGKSTICKKWERSYRFNEPHLQALNYGLALGDVDPNPRVVINADTIRLALHGKRFDASRESEVWEHKWLMIKTFLHQGYDILIDGTNTSHNTIWSILKIREDATPIFLGTPESVCVERAYSSGQPDLDEKGVIRRMFGNLENLWQLYADKEKCNHFDIADFPEWNKIIGKMAYLVHKEKLRGIQRLQFAKEKFAESLGVTEEYLDNAMKEVSDG